MKDPEFDPIRYPPFPDVGPCVQLETFRLARLEAGDQDEVNQLFETCTSRGFFYLDFTDSTYHTLPKQAEYLTQLSEKLFHLPQAEKQKYCYLASGKSLFGYKPPGFQKVDTAGTRDGNEMFNISKDDMVGNTDQLAWPDLIKSNQASLSRFQQDCHNIGMLILSLLATRLELSSDAFMAAHNFAEKSKDHVRFIRGPPRKTDPPEIQLPPHSDMASITVLFNWLGGLQLWSEAARGHWTTIDDPKSTRDMQENWLWVIPRPGTALLNLGDSASKFTNGLLVSGRHRVLSAPAEQGDFPRYSLAYFVRPNDMAIYKQLRGGLIPDGEQEVEQHTFGEWALRRAQALKAENSRS